jgi:two-component system, LytTR family, sensor kinase
MKDDFSKKPGRWKIAFLIVGFYALLSAFFIPRMIFMKDFSVAFSMFYLFALGNFLWAAFTPLVFLAGRHFPIIYPKIIQNTAIHFGISLVMALIYSAIYVSLVQLITLGRLEFNDILLNFVFNTITNCFIYYVGILAINQAFFYAEKFREREFLLQQAELSALQAQLHPHFFFNTLNALSALIYRSPKEADRMITRLGDLFRILLKKEKAQEISLKEELEFLEAYLQIHQTLMGERLKVEWNIAPETFDARVPNLILQPLVENSVKHGLAPLEEGGTIVIGAARENGFLRLEVTDNGIGAAIKQINSRDGIGLENTRARLRHLYGGEHQFKVTHPAQGGLRILIKIPLLSHLQ